MCLDRFWAKLYSGITWMLDFRLVSNVFWRERQSSSWLFVLILRFLTLIRFDFLLLRESPSLETSWDCFLKLKLLADVGSSKECLRTWLKGFPRISFVTSICSFRYRCGARLFNCISLVFLSRMLLRGLADFVGNTLFELTILAAEGEV